MASGLWTLLFFAGSAIADLRIMVGRLGLAENSERVRDRLLSAGANQGVTTQSEACSQLIPLLQSLSHVKQPKTSA